MNKLRQLQANRQRFTGFPIQKRKQISRPALAVVTVLSLILAASLIYFVSHLPTNKKQNIDQPAQTIVSVPGGQFIPTLEHPLNVLVMGVDSNGKNTERFTGTRSDSMILVSIDPKKQKVGVISIPRDSRVHIANGRGVDKINSAHALGGARLSIETVSHLLNSPIDRYIVVDTQGLKEILDSLGSVDVLVEKKMSYVDHTAKLYVNLEPGLQKLDAKQAEQYVRFRHDARGDIGRIERQQWFARQLLSKLAEPEMLVKLPSIIDTIRQSVMTDLNVDEMVRLFGFACHLNPKQVETASLPGIPGSINGISYWLLDIPACNAICSKLVNNYISADTSSVDISSPTADSAIAYAPPSEKFLSIDQKKTWSVIIRYPKGCEEQVALLEELLSKNNFKLNGKFRADLADCQHEQIIESSSHALSFDVDALRSKLSHVNNWPTVINIDAQPAADFTFVITPNTKFAS